MTKTKQFLTTCYRDPSATEVPPCFEAATRKLTFSTTSVLLLLDVPLSLSRGTIFRRQKNPRRGYRPKITGIVFVCNEPGRSIPYCAQLYRPVPPLKGSWTKPKLPVLFHPSQSGKKHCKLPALIYEKKMETRNASFGIYITFFADLNMHESFVRALPLPTSSPSWISSIEPRLSVPRSL